MKFEYYRAIQSLDKHLEKKVPKETKIALEKLAPH